MDHPEIILQIQDIELISSDLSGRKRGHILITLVAVSDFPGHWSGSFPRNAAVFHFT